MIEICTRAVFKKASQPVILGLHLHNWLAAHVLRREAEALLGAKPAKLNEPAPEALPKK